MECKIELPDPSGTSLALPSACLSAASDQSAESSGDISSELGDILDDIRSAAVRNPAHARMSVRRLMTLLASPAGGKRPNGRSGLAPWQKRKIDRYVRENLDRPLQRDDLAAQVSLSTCHFSRAFKETFAESPHAYVVRLRLEMAQEMMLSTGSSLSQIAFACGFADQSHFTKIFRDRIGTTPNAWRRFNLTEAQARTMKRAA